MQTEKIREIHPQQHIEIEYGTVHETDEDCYVVQGPSGLVSARRAFSCVVNPQAGDRVMYSHDAEEWHILAIIERVNGRGASLSFDGNISIESVQGSVTVSGKSALQMTCAGPITMLGDELNVIASRALVNIEDSTLSGQQLTSNISAIRTFARSIDMVAERLTQKLKNSLRHIDGVDQTSAGNMLTSIKNMFALRSHQSALLAKKDIKIDAERIHMG